MPEAGALIVQSTYNSVHYTTRWYNSYISICILCSLSLCCMFHTIEQVIESKIKSSGQSPQSGQGPPAILMVKGLDTAPLSNSWVVSSQYGYIRP